MVFYHHELPPSAPRLPRYLDLRYYASQAGVPFTFSSNLLHALHAAVKRVRWEDHFAELARLRDWLRPKLRELGFELVGSDRGASPAVVTLALPPAMNSVNLGDLIRDSGYLVSYHSEYLMRRNWIQICLMGECTREKVVSLLNAFRRAGSRKKDSATAVVKDS